MLTLDDNTNRELRMEQIDADLVVVGGGIAGSCAAITAAREGLRVVLVQDRPVLGGNTSSEVRLWMVGATSHMGNNNRWAREGGALNEILMENTFRNPEGNPVLFDTVLLEKVTSEPTLTLLLNTAVYKVCRKSELSIRSEASQEQNPGIKSLTAFCSQNSTRYLLQAPLFCDASGDGIVGFLSGAAFRVGAESQQEFGELLAARESTAELLGHSIYFYTRDTGHTVEYVPPDYALKDISQIPRYQRFNTKEQGTDLWWIEYGGSLDTVHATESIKWELWKIIYGVWNHIKNSGDFPDARTLTLDWVGLIPGKRESRRFEGDYMLTQQDIVEQRKHEDAVSFGGWAIDHHPVDNIYSEAEPCTQWHSKGVYQIPYRTMYSRNVPNLFLSGRIISASHIAFGSSRVMATCGHNGQAVGMAAAICREHQVQPRDLLQSPTMKELQKRLLRSGQYIPSVRREDPKDLAQQAIATSSSSLQRLKLHPQRSRPLQCPRALLLPLAKGRVPEVEVRVRYRKDTKLVAELRTCSRKSSFTPDVLLKRVEVPLAATGKVLLGSVCEGELKHATAAARSIKTDSSSCENGYSASDEWVEEDIRLDFDSKLENDCYGFVCFQANASIEVYESQQLVTGVTTVVNRRNNKVAKSNGQVPPCDSGIDSFDFWSAERRPNGRNLAISADLDYSTFAAKNVINGLARPTCRPNAWVASQDDPLPSLTLNWNKTQPIQTIEVVFDPDWDHPLENIVMQHPERVMPTVVRCFRVIGPDGDVLANYNDNHAAVVSIALARPIRTDRLTFELEHPSAQVPASLFEVRCYGPTE